MLFFYWLNRISCKKILLRVKRLENFGKIYEIIDK